MYKEYFVTVRNLDFFPARVARMERKSAFDPDVPKSKAVEKHALIIYWLSSHSGAPDRTVCVFETDSERDGMWREMRDAVLTSLKQTADYIEQVTEDDDGVPLRGFSKGPLQV